MGCYVSLIILLSATISRTEMVPLLTSFPFNNHVTSSFLSSLFSSFSSSSPSPLSRYKDYKDFSVNFCEEPKDSIVLKEQSIIMNCSISISSSSSPSSLLSSSPSLNEESVKGHQVTWLRNGQRLEYNDRRLLLKNGSLCLVSGGDKKLRRPGGADNDGDDVSGRYQCRVSIEGVGVVSSRVAKLEVSLMEKTWTEEPQSSILYLGDSIILGCRLKALPPPSVKWFKDEQEIETSKSNSGFLLHADGALEIPEVKRFHFGRYKCRVRQENDKKGKTSRTISLTEEVEVETMTIRTNTASTQCIVRSRPREKNDSLVEGDENTKHGRDREVPAGSIREVTGFTSSSSSSSSEAPHAGGCSSPV